MKDAKKKYYDIYVSIWCPYNLSIELSKVGRNRQHSMWDFHKENTAPQRYNSQ